MATGNELLTRKLTAILLADVVGYSRLMGEDEAGTLTCLKEHRKQLVDPTIRTYHGRIVKLMGDGALVEFPSVLEAVACALKIQEGMFECNRDIAEDKKIQFRLGVNLGDVIVDGDDIYGDGVNIASRLQALAEPGGICISDKVYQEILGKNDIQFVNGGYQQVKNISAPIQIWQWFPKNRLSVGSKSEAISYQDKPSIAVLPFTNMSGSDEQEYFADGISEDIITRLSRFHWFFVIARNSSFIYKGDAVDIKQVSRELGVKYVLEGSVRKANNHVRITAQLIDATSNHHLWAEIYDRNLEDIFAVQDEISEAITTTIAPAFLSVEAQRAERKTTESLDAWDYAMRGSWYLARRSEADIIKAKESFESALQIDPKFTTALSGLAFALCWINIYRWESNLDTVRKSAYSAAKLAVELDETDAWAQAILGWVLFSRSELDAAIEACETALEYNSSLALAESILAISYSWRGDYEKAIDHAKMAERLSPRDPSQSMWSFARTCAEFGAGNYEKAIKWAHVAIKAMPGFPGPWRYLASSLGHTGRTEEARSALQNLLKVMPNDSVKIVLKALPSDRAERMERFIYGLREAGLPEQ